ncbi:MAG: biopolymer transporter ExbD [Pseudomonadota bacterium]
MRFRSQTRRRDSDEENLVPLINIVFLILIFFLVASTIRPFADRDITLAESRETIAAGALRRAVLMRGDGTLVLSGNTITSDELNRALLEWRSEPDRTITIIADKNADAQAVAEIIAAASGAGLKSIKLLTRRARGGRRRSE